MRVILVSILLLALTPVFSQRKISYGFRQISQSQFDSCKQALAERLLFKKVDSLMLTLDGMETKFQILRSESYPGFSVLEAADRLLIITDSTGVAENIIGVPCFSSDSTLFASFGFSAIHRRQMLQIGEIKNGIIDPHLYLRPAENIVIQELGCIYDGKVYLKDTSGKFWICNYKLE